MWRIATLQREESARCFASFQAVVQSAYVAALAMQMTSGRREC